MALPPVAANVLVVINRAFGTKSANSETLTSRFAAAQLQKSSGPESLLKFFRSWAYAADVFPGNGVALSSISTAFLTMVAGTMNLKQTKGLAVGAVHASQRPPLR